MPMTNTQFQRRFLHLSFAEFYLDLVGSSIVVPSWRSLEALLFTGSKGMYCFPFYSVIGVWNMASNSPGRSLCSVARVGLTWHYHHAGGWGFPIHCRFSNPQTWIIPGLDPMFHLYLHSIIQGLLSVNSLVSGLLIGMALLAFGTVCMAFFTKGALSIDPCPQFGVPALFYRYEQVNRG